MNDKHALTPALWLLFLLVGFPQFSETVYSPALPDIVNNLHTNNDLVQWTLSIYFIGFALGVFIWGRISDRMGRRPAMLMGVSIYIAGSLLCFIANHIGYLLFARLVQGLGASCGSVLTQAIARESLQGEKRHQFFAATGFIIAFSIALGPFVGGYLTQLFSWRANFLLLVILGISIILLTSLRLPETRCAQSIQNKKISEVLVMLAKDKYVLGCIWLVAAVNGILFSYYAEGPFIFIQQLHLTESQYGWLGSMIAAAALLGSLCAKHMLKHFSAIKLIAIGCTIMLLSSVLLVLNSLSGLITTFHPVMSVVLIMIPMMGIIFGSFGCIIPMALSTALHNYQSVLGTASALFGLSYYIVIALLTGIMGLIHTGTLLPMPIYFLVLSIISMIIYYSLIKESKGDPI